MQYLNAFIRMYGAEAVEAASAALSGEAPFYGLQAVDSDLQAFPAHQSHLKAYVVSISPPTYIKRELV
ncbi:hypothetical protein KAM622c_33580 [Klebsiella quasipneumoniae subsp. quasipneumoniae]|nr:hypothetical protein KAM622c_33580 [Klebsiella quasipneumoniae subsp. quasipneumoniae]